MLHHSMLIDITIVFLVALAGGTVAQLFKQSPLVGYIIGGIVAGPQAVGLVQNTASINEFAEIGVILLMFTLGIEFSLSRLASVKKIAILGGITQIILQVLIAVILWRFMQVTAIQAIFIGCVVSISSTMIVLRVLGDQGQLNSMHGQVMLGLLIVQDLAVVVMVSLLPRLGKLGQINWLDFAGTMGVTLGFVLLTVFMAQRVVPILMTRVVRSNNADLFLVLALSLGMGVAALFQHLGASVSLGAFLAGLLVSDSDYAHELLGKVASLKDAFVILFFVSAGMLINPRALFTDIHLLVIVLLLVLPIKFLLFYGITRVFRYHKRIAFYVGIGLMQTGEFSFVMAKIGLDNGIINPVIYNVLLASTLITILTTPTFIRLAPVWYKYFAKLTGSPAKSGNANQEIDNTSTFCDHVLLAGYGRVGQQVGIALQQMNIPFIATDYDFRAVKHMKQENVNYVYGDASNINVLRQLAPQTAKLAVLALPDVLINEQAIRKLHRLNPELHIICRAHSHWEKDRLYEAGAYQVVQPEEEAGLQMVRHMIVNLDLPEEQIIQHLENYYIKDYHSIAKSYSLDAKYDEPLTVRTFVVPEHSKLVGCSLDQSYIRENTSCTVVTIKRGNGEVIINPHSSEIIQADDILIAMGTAGQLHSFAGFCQLGKED